MLDASEAYRGEHGGHAGDIRPPPVAAIATGFSAGIEHHGRPGMVIQVDVGFDNEPFPSNVIEQLERQERMLEMVEDPKEQHAVELADRIGPQFPDVTIDRFDARRQPAPGELKAFKTPELWMFPSRFVESGDPGGPAFDRLDAEIAVPCPDIEHALALDRIFECGFGL